MKLKDFDYKGYLLQHGERVGVAVAGALVGLLVVSMIWTGLSSGSPAEKAEALRTLATGLTQRLNTAQPTPDDKPEADADKKLIAFKFAPVESNSFALNRLLDDQGGVGEAGRRPPRIFPIEEGVAAIGRVQVRAYIFSSGDTPKLTALVEDSRDKNPPPPPPDLASNKAALKEYLRQLARQQGRGIPIPPGMGPGAGGRGEGGPGRPGLPSSGAGSGAFGSDKKDLTTIHVSINDVKPETRLAEQVWPLRLALIGASFPYKKQIEEFKAKLNLRGVNDVLTEAAAEPGPDKEPLPSFRFQGVEVERRELGLDGKPITEFKPVDLNGSYRPYIYINGKRFEPDDPKYAPITFYGLVMPKLLQFREHEFAVTPGGVGEGVGIGRRPEKPKEEPKEGRDLYPKVEEQLKTIKATLESLKGKNLPEATAAPPRFKTDDFDPFAPRSDTLDPKSGEAREPGFGSPKRRPGGKGEAAAPGTETETAIEDVPEHCLVRVVDVTVEPGKTYEYRLRIRMANPNYRRNDVASPDYAKDEVLKSEWSNVPIIVHVDPDLYYYAVDPADIEKYTGPHSRPINKEKQVVLQAHRWLDRIPQGREPLSVGEWTIAERMPISRGEYIGRMERVQVPYWRYTREEFVLADDGKSDARRGGRPSMNVHFGYNRPDRNQPEAILVDFDSGQASYNRVVKRGEDRVETKPVKDSTGVEVILLSPEGRLLVRSGAEDLQDSTRTKRVEEYKQRIKDVLEKKTGTKPGDKPFGGGGPTGAGK